MPILPAMNTLWFWFDKTTRRDLHGTPADVMRKFEILDNKSCLEDGLEIFIIPSRLKESKPFDASFIKKFSKLPHRSLHIGDSDIDFLNKKNTFDDFLNLAKVMSQLETDTIIIHSHHLKENREFKRKLLLNSLKNSNILVENNGFDNEWGSKAENIKSILNDYPEFNLCLDIAHINDFKNLKLHDFIKDPLILKRIAQIHFSYSTILIPGDPYEEKGYYGYGPFHALFSVLGKKLSNSTKEFINNFPIILEGIVPKEDKDLYYLKKEKKLITQGD